MNKNVFYDRWLSKQAIDQIKNNPFLAKETFEQYLTIYPRDFSTYPYYISLLITIGEFDKAQEVLDYIEKEFDENSKFLSNNIKFKIFKNNIIYSKCKLYANLQNFDKLYNLLISNPKIIERFELQDTLFYCKSKMGLIKETRDEINRYLYKQIIEYDINDFYDHIKKHLYDCSTEFSNESWDKFFEDFPLKEIINESKKYIPSNKCLYKGFYTSVYVFKFDNCGKVNNKTVDYFKIICLENNSNFITMYPADDCKYLPYIDLNYLKQENEPPKIKRLSQIEKFNQKYNK